MGIDLSAANNHEPPMAPRTDCGLCLRSGVDLVDSHIFPRWMGKEIRDDGPLLAIATHAETDPKFVHRFGEYDRIACAPCERSFGAADQHFADFSRARESARVESRGEVRLHVYSGWNQALIQRFFLTCLFRAHLSTRPFFARVDLGPHADRLRRVLLSPTSAITLDFEVTLFRETHVVSDSIVSPIRTRMAGQNFYRMSVPGFGAFVRVDRRQTPGAMSFLALGAWPDIRAVELSEIHPDLLHSLAKAEILHSDRLNRMIAPRQPP